MFDAHFYGNVRARSILGYDLRQGHFSLVTLPYELLPTTQV